LRIADEQFRAVQAELQAVAGELEVLEDEFERLGAPWTPSRLPGPVDR
jgi:hypothetical protein